MLSIAHVLSEMQMDNSHIDIFDEDNFNGMPALTYEEANFSIALTIKDDLVFINYEDYNNDYVINFPLVDEHNLMDIYQELASAIQWISLKSSSEVATILQKKFIQVFVDNSIDPDDNFVPDI